MPTSWFIPSPDASIDQRVTLTLGMGASQRFFREVIFPGIGGAMFVRHCSWAAAALALREDVPHINPSIIANGIEALACKLHFSHAKEGEELGRVRGVRAFSRDPDCWSFRELSQPKNYVQITFRQSVVTALSTDFGLGFAEGGRRFNGMTLTSHGDELARAFLSQPVGRGGGPLKKWLVTWLSNRDAQPEEIRAESIRLAISPRAFASLSPANSINVTQDLFQVFHRPPGSLSSDIHRFLTRLCP